MSSERLPPDDSELEDFLAGRHPVGRAYREGSENEGAPPELDAAILAAAREAVRTPVVRRPRWVQPVALAATLVLGVSVLMNLWRDPETRELIAPAAPPVSHPIEESSVNDVRGAAADSADAAVPPVSAEMQKKKEKPERPEPEATTRAPAAKAPPPPPPAAMPERDDPRFKFHELRESAPVAEPSPAQPGSSLESAPARAQAESKARVEREVQSQSRQRDDDELGPQASGKAEPAAAAVQDSAESRSADAVAPQPAANAEQWIARIRAELARGDEAAARDSLAAFRHAYPDAAVPEDVAAFERVTGESE